MGTGERVLTLGLYRILLRLHLALVVCRGLFSLVAIVYTLLNKCLTLDVKAAGTISGFWHAEDSKTLNVPGDPALNMHGRLPGNADGRGRVWMLDEDSDLQFTLEPSRIRQACLSRQLPPRISMTVTGASVRYSAYSSTLCQYLRAPTAS